MAPEMFTAQPVFASDQYALAVMAYQWLCGTLPFGEGDFYQLGYQHTHEPVPPLRDKVQPSPAAVEAVVLKGLAKQPQDRFPSVREFAEALEAASKKPANWSAIGQLSSHQCFWARVDFTCVYLGQHANVATQQAAIKVLHLAGVDQQKCQLEAETIAALRHPHIVRLLDFDFQRG